MSKHPYAGLPDYRFWKSAVETPCVADVDPVISFPFKLKAEDKIATAGSCFAQHISRHLSRTGFNYYVAEQAPLLVNNAAIATKHNFGTFSARYGNIYTVRQLLQLLLRAYGEFDPVDQVWSGKNDALVDPFRPQVQPGGYINSDDLLLDRDYHLSCVRRMFETLDVFVFTLGLTEAWRAKADGAVFPLCPGVSGGAFDPERYEFHNFTVSEVCADMTMFLNKLKNVNPRAKAILTVSPVPLVATYEDRHVLVSTTYSKSVLRVACDEMARSFDWVAYFPSYEIITGNYARGSFYDGDLRSILPGGVHQVMSLFTRHCTVAGHKEPIARSQEERVRVEARKLEQRLEQAGELVCEEEALGRREA